jgi:twitching motility protein PilT
VHQIDGLIGSSGQEKMFSMDSYITKLYKEGKITRETALDYATAPELMAQKLLERV